MKKRKSARRKTYRRRSRVGALPTTGAITGALTTGATVLGGYAAAGMLDKITFLQSNPMIGNIVKIAAGIFVPSVLKGNMGAGLAAGMVARGVQGLVVDNFGGIATTLGLAGIPEMNPYYSVVGGFNDPGPMNSIAGASSGLDKIMLRVR